MNSLPGDIAHTDGIKALAAELQNKEAKGINILQQRRRLPRASSIGPLRVPNRQLQGSRRCFAMDDPRRHRGLANRLRRQRRLPPILHGGLATPSRQGEGVCTRLLELHRQYLQRSRYH